MIEDRLDLARKALAARALHPGAACPRCQREPLTYDARWGAWDAGTLNCSQTYGCGFSVAHYEIERMRVIE